MRWRSSASSCAIPGRCCATTAACPSATVALSILKRAIEFGDRGMQFMAAFGPGFSAYFVAAEFLGKSSLFEAHRFDHET